MNKSFPRLFKSLIISTASLFFITCNLFSAVSTSMLKLHSQKFKKHMLPSVEQTPKRKLTEVDTAAFANFKAQQGSKWRLKRNTATLAPGIMSGLSSVTYSGSPKDAAINFLENNEDFLKLGVNNLKFEFSKKSPLGIDHIYFSQTYGGLEVIGKKVTVHLRDGRVLFYSSSFVDGIDISLTPSVTRQQAKSAVLSQGAQVKGTPELAVFPSTDGNNYLVWKMKAVNSSGRWVYLVNAQTAEVLFVYSLRAYATTGTITGEIYETFPNSKSISGYPVPYSNYTTKPIGQQYVWVQSYSNQATTNVSGVYNFPSTDGKIFALLQGPYFSVVNQESLSAYHNNAAVSWADKTTSLDLPSGSGNYANSTIYASTVTPTITETYPLALIPVFGANFSVGSIDRFGTITDSDYASILNPTDSYKVLAVYRGEFLTAFDGPFVPDPSYRAKLVTDTTGQNTGFTLDNTKLLYFPASSNPTTAGTLATYTFTWDTTQTSVDTREEVNAFYHLNAARTFLQNGVNLADLSSDGSTRVVYLNFHTPVIVRATGTYANQDGLWNAFYDTDGDYMVIGKGPVDPLYSVRRLSFALDSSILRHEYIHAVVDRIFPIWYFGESGAISEGLSDYFALSSMRTETSPYAPLTTKFGEYFESYFGSTIVRDLKDDCDTTASNCLVYPTDWVSEVHDDGRIVGQILWSMRDSSMTTTWLGDITASDLSSSAYTGPRSDLILWHSLLFFPDTLFELKEAMLKVCQEFEDLDGTNACSAAHRTKIALAFSRHGVTDANTGDTYEPNDGTDDAVNVSKLDTISATIYPSYDTDYYTFSASPGKFTAVLNLPASDYANNYHTYMMILLSSNNADLVTAYPTINNSLGYCPDTGDCLTKENSVTLEYDITESGRYILMVSAGPNYYYYNGPGFSSTPYTLNIDYTSASSDLGSISTASFDNDIITFSVPYTKFAYQEEPEWDSTLDAKVETYYRARLLDQDMVVIPDADTSGSLVSTVTTSATATHINGQVRINPGFHARYPSAGTVYLEILGQTTDAGTGDGRIVSLAIAGPLQLTANTTEVIVWNNILNLNNSEKAIIYYSLETAGNIDIKLYTRSGFKVKDLYNGYAAAGKHSVSWSGVNASGKKVASGMYFIKIKGPGLDIIEKIIVVK